jgi:uncharacterized repeat protein (TIGR01451 family)
LKNYKQTKIFFAFLFLACQLNGQVTISDSVFLQALIDYGVDTNQDGQIQVAEAEAITVLEIEFEDISSISGIEAFSNLNRLKLGHTLIESADLTNNLSLSSVNLADNELTEVNVAGLPQLKELVLRNNGLMDLELGNLPNLEELDAENNHLSSIDLAGLSKMQDLNLDENELSSLDLSGMPNLQKLEVVKNNLEAIDFSENLMLKNVHISDNGITSIDVKHLKDLRVLLLLRCPIETLDVAGLEDLFTLWVNHSSVKTIYMKRASPDQSQLKFEGAPLKHICADQSYIPTVIDELGDANITDCLVTSFCPYTDEGVLGGISGKVKFGQSIEDCETSTNYVPFPKFQTEWLSPSGQDIGVLIGPEDGSFSINYYGSMTLTPSTSYFPEWKHIIHNFSASNYSSNPQNYEQDFCLIPNVDKVETEISIIPLEEFRAGFESNLILLVRNTGTLPFSGVLTLYLPQDSLSYVSSSHDPMNIESASVSWEIQDLLPFNDRSIEATLRLNSPMDEPPLYGDEGIVLCAELTAVDQYNNVLCIEDLSVNSFDPNDKTFMGPDTVKIDQIGELDELTYLIRFENTGTASAINVVISDELDDEFIVPSSIRIIDASHDVVLEMQEDNVANFIFKDIYLPFEPGYNRGYVLFSVESETGNISVNNRLDNQAAIYFDFNYPIITNEASIWVVEEVINSSRSGVTDKGEIKIFPNPSAGSFVIESELGHNPIETIEWIDVNGRVQRVDRVDAQSLRLSETGLEAGIYSLRITTAKFVQIQKVVIQGD